MNKMHVWDLPHNKKARDFRMGKWDETQMRN